MKGTLLRLEKPKKGPAFMRLSYIFLILFSFAFFRCSTAAEVSFTFDDFDVSDSTLIHPKDRNESILKAFDDHQIKTTLFVQAKNIDSDHGKGLLNDWDKRGHQIANHTYSHLSYSSDAVSFSKFSEDFLKADALIKDFVNYTKIFRFPYLHEGNTEERRDQFREFLKDHHYDVGHVTIDASDWYIDARMRVMLAKEPKTNLSAYRNYFLNHIWSRAIFYNELSKKVLGREVKHTLLLHYNLLNALFLDDLISMFKEKGWKTISSSEAFSDPVFKAQPIIVPAGNSILWGLAKESGKYDGILRDPGEGGDYEKEAMDKLGL